MARSARVSLDPVAVWRRPVSRSALEEMTVQHSERLKCGFKCPLAELSNEIVTASRFLELIKYRRYAKHGCLHCLLLRVILRNDDFVKTPKLKTRIFSLKHH